jgi:hypothetical protein
MAVNLSASEALIDGMVFLSFHLLLMGGVRASAPARPGFSIKSCIQLPDDGKLDVGTFHNDRNNLNGQSVAMGEKSLRL